MDVSKSHDPLAPEGTDLSADAETPAEGDPQGAVSDPVHSDDASDVSAASADSEAQDAPESEGTYGIHGEDADRIAQLSDPGTITATVTDSGFSKPAEEPSPFFEPVADPTSPVESAGPTEPETAAGEGEKSDGPALGAHPGPDADVVTGPEPQPVDEHDEPIPVPEPDAEAEVTPEPENPTTEGEAH